MTGMPAATANSISFEQVDLWASPAIASIGTTRTDADNNEFQQGFKQFYTMAEIILQQETTLTAQLLVD